MKFSRNDGIFTASIIAGIAALSALLYLHSRERSVGKGQAIGKVFFKREIAMRKFSDRMVWEDVDSGTALYAHDAVMTGGLSDAELRLDSGLKLKLEANTLVELDLEAEGLTLRLSGGGIKTTGAQNTNTLVATQSGQTINVTDASANIRTQGNQTSVEVKEGKVDVTAKDGKKETVKKDEILAAGKKAKVALNITTPAEDAMILVSAANARVNLGCGPDGSATHAELGRNGDMSRAKKFKLSGNTTAARVPSGDWFMRCVGDDGAISSVRRFRVVNAGQYKVYRPERNEIAFEDKAVLQLEFKPPQTVTTTLVEVADNANFTKPIFAEKISRNAVAITLPKAGQYYYRLTPATDSGKIESALKPYVAATTFTQTTSRVALSFVSVTNPIFALAQIESSKATVGYEGTGKFTAQIFRSGEAEAMHTATTENGSFIIPKNLTGGKYVLRLIQGSEKAEQPFEVRDKIKVEITSPANGAVYYLTPPEKSTAVSVAWKGSEDVQRYELVLADDQAMKTNVRRVAVEGNEHRLTGLGAKKYFLKVLAYENNVARAETATIALQIQENLPPVAEIFTKPNQQMDVVKAGGLNMKWQPVAGANSYEVKIFQKRKDGLTLVETRTTKSPGLAMAEVGRLREGDAVLEVRAQQTNKKGRVIQKSEPTRSNVNVSFGPTPPAPEIVPSVDE